MSDDEPLIMRTTVIGGRLPPRLIQKIDTDLTARVVVREQSAH